MSRRKPFSEIDDRLRDVPLPAGLLARLREAAGWNDQRLDAELRDISVPEDLVSRLRQSIADEVLDESVRGVELPGGLLARLRLIATRRAETPMMRWAVAASLFFLIGGVYLLAIAGLFAGMRPEEPDDLVWQIPYEGPLDVEARVHPDSEPQPIVFAPALPPQDAEVEPDIHWVDDVIYPDSRRLRPVAELLATINNGTQFNDDIFLVRYGPLGSPQRAADDLPRFDEPPLTPPGGLQAPVLRGSYNRRFLLKYGVHPPVSPADHPQLASIAVPLSTSTASFDLTARRVAEHRLPDPAEIRVEDFLAAVDYRFSPARPNRLELRVSAGPAVFRRELNPQLIKELGPPPGPAALLQIGVTATPAARRGGEAVSVTVALDVSGSMRWDGRLEMVQRGVRALVARMGPQDRVSFIAFNADIVQRIENVDREHAEDLCAAVDQLQASGGTNLAGGLQQAVSLALSPSLETVDVRRLILISDGRVDLPGTEAGAVREMLGLAAKQGLGFVVLDLDDGRGGETLLADLAAAAHGRLDRVRAADELQWRLAETFADGPSLVAHDATLTVTFRPEVVAAYRLLGHEARGMAGLLPVNVEAELRGGQAATALFEIWLRPGTENEVGWTEIQWTDPETGEVARVLQPISRGQFAASFDESALSLQAAAIAAETAEVLRQSPWASARSRNLEQVLHIAHAVNPRLAEDDSFQRFVAVVQGAQRVIRQSTGN